METELILDLVLVIIVFLQIVEVSLRLYKRREV